MLTRLPSPHSAHPIFPPRQLTAASDHLSDDTKGGGGDLDITSTLTSEVFCEDENTVQHFSHVSTSWVSLQ